MDEDVPRIGMHIQTSLEDAVVKARLTRQVSGRRICAGCMSNMLTVTWAMIYDIDQAFKLPFYFAGMHRQSKCACSAGHTDMLIGLCALLADVNGLGKYPSHIKDKLSDMMMAASTAHGCALGSAMEGTMHPSGVYMPDPVIANSGLSHIRSLIAPHLARVHDIAGGLMTTMPTEADWNNPDLRRHIEEALAGNAAYTVEERLRVMNLVQDLAASRLTGTLLGFAINAAGSPETNKVLVRSLYDLEEKKQIAKEIACIA